MSASQDNPYSAFSFRIMLNGNYVAGVSLVIHDVTVSGG